MRTRSPETQARIVAAIETLAAKGREPSIREVRKQIIRDDPAGIGASLETIAPVLAAWSEQELTRASGRIDAALDAIVALRNKSERDEFSRLLQQRTEGALRIRFTVKGTPRRQTPFSISGPTGDTLRPRIITRSRSRMRIRRRRST